MSAIRPQTPGKTKNWQAVERMCLLLTLQTRLQSEESSSRKASPSCSPYLGEFAELPSPSSPGSLLSSEWSGSPEAFEGSGHNPQSSHLSVTCVFSQLPIDPFANVLASAVSPQAQNIPFQYADSIFEEKPLEDALEVDAIWEGADDQSMSELHNFHGHQ